MGKVQSQTSKDKEPESELVLSLLKTIDEFNGTIEELKAKLNENSSKSNYPSSRDLYHPVRKERRLERWLAGSQITREKHVF